MSRGRPAHLMPDDALMFVDRFDGIADGDPEPFTFTARLESAP